jgi:N-acetyltransferase
MSVNTKGSKVAKPRKRRAFTDTPPSSPIAPQFKQTFLAIGSQTRETCKQCGMSYLKHISSDVKMHQKYHQRCLDGRDWNIKSDEEPLVQISHDECIYKVNPQRQSEVVAALDLLEIVNRYLNAPDDNDFWLNGDDGVVFVYVKQGVAIGVISVEKVTQGRWFSVEDGIIVSKLNLELLCGISRIYVCQSHRRSGIALKLLQTVQRHFVYGLSVPKMKIGWSQPSSSGGKLASAFSGLKHRTGKVLIPVYVSDSP